MNKLLKKVVLTTASFVGLMGAGTLAADASTYTVKSGDSLWEIANDNGTTINSILTDNSNKLSSINSVIHPGEQLELNQATNNYISSNEQTNTTPNIGNNSYASSSDTNSASSTSSNDSVSSVAQEMQERTGVSASEWETIINRESGGDPTAQNPSSSAHGLFQQLGETSNNVQTQINDACTLYAKQKLNAWSETR